MKKALLLTSLTLCLMLPLSACQMPDALLFEGVTDNETLGKVADFLMFWKKDEEEALPEETEEPEVEETPQSTRQLTGASAEVETMLQALRDGDSDTVLSYSDEFPGYSSNLTLEDETLLLLYREAYSNLTWHYGAVNESMTSVTAEAELTTRDMRYVMESLSQRLSDAVSSGQTAGLDNASLRALFRNCLQDAIDEEPVYSTKKVTLVLKNKDDQWKAVTSSPINQALTGSLTIALQNFAIPDLNASQPEILDKDNTSANKYLFANDYGSIVIKSIEPNAPEGYKLTVYAQNNCSQSMVFSVSTLQINSYLFNVDWSVELERRGSQTGTIVIDRNLLAQCGIDTVYNISGDVKVYEKPAWPVYTVSETHFTVSPNGKNNKTSPAVTAEDELRLVDNGTVVFSVLDTTSYGPWGYEMKVYFENNSGEELWFALGELYINGVEIDPLWSCKMPTGAKAVQTIRLKAGDLILNSIDEMKTVNFRLYISSLDDIDDKDNGYSAGGTFTLVANSTAVPEDETDPDNEADAENEAGPDNATDSESAAES